MLDKGGQPILLLARVTITGMAEHTQEPQKPDRWKYPNIEAPEHYRVKSPVMKPRTSLLDEFSSESKLNSSEFRGFYNLALIFGMFFLFTKPFLNFFERGNFFSPYLYNSFKIDFFLCIMVWPCFYIWSFTSLMIEKAIVAGLPQSLGYILQHLSQTGMFIFSIVLILKKNWCATHSAFVIMQTSVHYMKMHSFSVTNRDYRTQAKEAKLSDTKPLSNYPHNLTLSNYTEFLWTPVLTYSETYPRLATRDYGYILKKCVVTLLNIMAAYMIHTDYILPHIEQGDRIGFLELLMRCMLPVTILLIVIFFIVFENIENIFAEITRFADRQFYDEWWNSSTFEEFNRLWNKPVHNFLYRHVYLESLLKYKLNKNVAQLLTFAFSAVLHELLLALVFKTFRPVFLCFIIGQIPLFYLTRWMRGTAYGNYLFWFGITLGPTLITCVYLRIDSNVTNLFTRYPVAISN